MMLLLLLRHVFPTCVGMNRIEGLGRPGHAGVPHMRGDEPILNASFYFSLLCSPHAWG